MQYILSEEEYKQLKTAQTHSLTLSKKKLQTLCTNISNTMPVKWGWSKNEEAKPWHCYLTEEEEWYCDSCPVQDICPAPKHWSK